MNTFRGQLLWLYLGKTLSESSERLLWDDEKGKFHFHDHKRIKMRSALESVVKQMSIKKSLKAFPHLEMLIKSTIIKYSVEALVACTKNFHLKIVLIVGFVCREFFTKDWKLSQQIFYLSSHRLSILLPTIIIICAKYTWIENTP